MTDVRSVSRGHTVGPEVRRLSERLARDPASLVFLQLGEALRRDGRLEQAQRVAEAGVARHPELVDAHALLGRVAADAGRLLQAEACWREVERLAPGHVDAARGLAFVRWCEGRTDEAREYLEEAFARTDDDATRRSITAAINRLAEAPNRRVIAPTPHVAPAVLHSKPVAETGVRPAPAAVAAEMSQLLRQSNRVSEALQIGSWRALLVECDTGLLGVSVGANGIADEEDATFHVADGVTAGQAVRMLLQREENV